MTFRSYRAFCLAGALLALPAAAPASADQHQLSVRNDTGQTARCGVRRAGSSAADSFTLREGQVWTENYSGPKERLIVCEGAYSAWQTLAPDRPYRLVKPAPERIVAEPAS